MKRRDDERLFKIIIFIERNFFFTGLLLKIDCFLSTDMSLFLSVSFFFLLIFTILLLFSYLFFHVPTKITFDCSTAPNSEPPKKRPRFLHTHTSLYIIYSTYLYIPLLANGVTIAHKLGLVSFFLYFPLKISRRDS